MSLEILYEDNHMLALWKPHGLLSQPSGTAQENLEDLAKRWLKEKYQKPGDVYLHAIHRLDRAAAGIVMFAKTSKALSRLTASIRERQAKKLYEAWVEGTPSQEAGTLEHYLIHDSHQAQVVSEGTREAKLARLHYRVLKKEGLRTLLEIDLETGRYHQIRAQLAAIGCPIVGDAKYGAKMQSRHAGISLEHVRMELPHPITQAPLVVQR